MRPLSEWDAAYLDEVASLDETTNLEKKSSIGFDAKKDATKSEIAKQVCAFANSGEGVLAFGFRDKDKSAAGVDEGIPEKVGSQTVKDWVEALIPGLHHPPIEGCEARFIQHASHATDRGVLVISVPLSERRPHWTRGEEKAYLRVGAHSAPMRPQTLLDINSRGMVPIGSVLDLRIERKPHPVGERSIPNQFDFVLDPLVLLDSGPVCEVWGVELILSVGGASFNCLKKGGNSNGIQLYAVYDCVELLANASETSKFFIRGREPLFPRRETPVNRPGFAISLTLNGPITSFHILAKLFASSALSSEKRFDFEVSGGVPIIASK